MITIALIGCHGAGKTSLGRALSAALALPFHDEIGRRLALDPALRPRGRTAEHSQAAFDRRVIAEELARDARWPSGRPRIVETWHPGNLAYARLRSPRVVLESWAPIATRARGALVLPVRAAPETLAARQSEPGALAFFQRVAAESERVARQLGAVVLPPVRTDNTSPQALAARLAPLLLRELSDGQVAARLSSAGGSP